ncbi:MAG: tRNA pseudouridine(55) synthase TruB [Bacilli bacterium]|nr:tRNA pseudouridine(55) synthase TruB [Bacilli bacterium]
MDGILLINKPKGITSHDVLYKLKKILNVKKIGHVGTLDPQATGLLVVLINEATKIADFLKDHEKEYNAEIVFGESTDTQDGEGIVVASQKVNKLGNVDDVLDSFVGKQQQIPPMFSAIKIKGQKLYELARRGEDIVREPRNIEIFEIKRTSTISYENNKATFSFYVHTTKGTYIRSLCVDIGQRMNLLARLGNLQRLSSGKFHLKNSFSIEEVIEGKYQLINMIDALDDYPSIEVDEKQQKKIANGIPFDIEELRVNHSVIVFKANDELKAVYELDNGKYRAKRVWN